jgi:antitoxin component HigA of HigAB toxin-antitoxin module
MAAIRNEDQLQQAIEQIQTLCRAIESLRTDIFPKNPKNFAIMAEGPVDEIRKLQSDIDAYIQHLEATGTSANS